MSLHDPELWAGFDEMTAEDVAGPVWDEPVPLNPRGQLPVFPVDALPGWLGTMAAEVAEETQTPVDLAGCLALAVLGTAAAWTRHRPRPGPVARACEPLHRRRPAARQPQERRVLPHDAAAPGGREGPRRADRPAAGRGRRNRPDDEGRRREVRGEGRERRGRQAGRADRRSGLALPGSRPGRHPRRAPARRRRHHRRKPDHHPRSAGRPHRHPVPRGRDLRDHRRTLLRRPEHGDLPQGAQPATWSG